MKKRAFTMVELIFVIVILGILAAVAVPRLNASREDAKVAAAVADMRTIWGDIQSYYLAQGEIAKNAKITPMSNAPLEEKNWGAIYNLEGKECLRMGFDKGANCLNIFTPDYVSDACRKAVEKAEFLRGYQIYVAGYETSCTDAMKKAKISSLHESKADSRGWQGIEIFFGEDGVEW